MKIKKKFIWFVLILLILPFVYAVNYGAGNYSAGVYDGARDEDNDEIADQDFDNLLYNKTYMTTSGLTDFNITLDGYEAHGTFSGSKTVLFYDETNLMVNFTHDFNQSNILNLSRVEIQKASTYIIVNFSGQIRENKTVYIRDNSFVALCVKDEEISTISEMSSGCNGGNETSFTTCLGNGAGTTLNGITCTDEGSQIKVENLQYSAIRGTLESAAPPPGGGGGGGIVPTKVGFTVTPTYEKTVVQNTIDYGEIEITNREDSIKSFNIGVELLEEIISFEEEIIRIPAGETEELEFMIQAPEETGIYVGKIIINSGSTRKEVLVVINVRTEKSLFDIALLVPRSKINVGENLSAQIGLFQIGKKEETNVSLNYIIKDFNGGNPLLESERTTVYDQKSFIRNFFTAHLIAEDYVLGVEAIYPEGVTIASSRFRIRERLEINATLIILILFAIFVFTIISLTIKKHKKMIKHLHKRKSKKR